MAVTKGGEWVGRGDWDWPWIRRRTIRKARPLQRQGAAGKTRPPGAAAIGVAKAADTTHLEIPGFSRRKIALGPLLAHGPTDNLSSTQPGILTNLKQIHENHHPQDPNSPPADPAPHLSVCALAAVDGPWLHFN